jgi:hypothetical protein
MGELSFNWFQYKETEAILPVGRGPSGTLFNSPRIADTGVPSQAHVEVPDFDFNGTATSAKLKVTMSATPAVVAGDGIICEQGKRYHIFLEVTSSAGAFPLTRYRRVIISMRGTGSSA